MTNIDAVLDKMTNKILAYDEIAFLDMVQYVWRRGWSLESAKKPMNDSPIRLALKACILERMVEIWGLPPKNISGAPPTWCKEVPALQERFNVIPTGEQHHWKNESGNPTFAKRNIYAPMEYMYFL